MKYLMLLVVIILIPVQVLQAQSLAIKEMFRYKGWKTQGSTGFTMNFDKDSNQNIDLLENSVAVYLKISKILGKYSMSNAFNVNYGKKIDNGIETTSPDIFEFDADWKKEPHHGFYHFINFSLDTNSKFKNDLLTHLTGGIGYYLDDHWIIETGYGGLKNFRPDLPMNDIITGKALYSQSFSNSFSVTESIIKNWPR